ncbi:beta-lactamase/transpeptidase-like protein [Aspergillus spectabilis]
MGAGKNLKCVVIGDHGVGKTSLLISYTTKDFPGKDTPVLLEFSKVDLVATGITHTLHLWDTTYEPGYTRLSPIWYPNTDIFLVCFSINSPDSFDRVEERWVPEVQYLCPGTSCLIVGTKRDLREDQTIIDELRRQRMRPVQYKEAVKLARSLGYSYVECSARTHDGVDDNLSTVNVWCTSARRPVSIMDTLLRKHYETEPTPFHAAALTAYNAEGNVIHASTVGTQTTDPAGPAVTEDSIFWVASMTKIVTAVAVMIVVERGLIGLDDDVGGVVTELTAPDILIGFDDSGEPILRRAKANITLRKLLTHTSGFTYSLMSPNLQRWAAYHGKNIDHTQGTYESITYPLVAEPGEEWMYGPGPDWAGRVVEVLSGKKLGEFVHENICIPLNLELTTFHPETLPDFDFTKKRVEIGLRNPDGTFTPAKEIFPLPAPADLGGASLYSTPREFTKFLSALLSRGRGIITPESVDEIFSPQLSDPVRRKLNDQINMPFVKAMKWMFTPGDKVDFGLTVAITAEDVPGGRKEGTVSWGGHTNTHWWIDRKSGVCATSFFHHLPQCDPAVVAVRDGFERGLYNKIRLSISGS